MKYPVKSSETESVFWRIVRCPFCKNKLIRTRTCVRCRKCHTRYYYRRGILHLYSHLRISKEVKKQKKHFNWYADNEKQSYDTYEKTPFWTNVDRDTFDRWLGIVPTSALVLDVGCAQGRSAFPFIRRKMRVIGYDISDALVEIAQKRSVSFGLTKKSPYFFVGDASNFSFSDASCDVVVLHGVLHHLSNPDHICKEIARVLKPGGIFFGLENNTTPARWVFDALQRLVPQWQEEAGEKPLISKHMISRWFGGTGMSVTCRTRVFMLPHVINVFPSAVAHWLLQTTEMLCIRLPLIRSWGGLIEIIGKKNTECGIRRKL